MVHSISINLSRGSILDPSVPVPIKKPETSVKEAFGFDYVREKLIEIVETSLWIPNTLLSRLSKLTNYLFKLETPSLQVDLFEAKYKKVEDTDAFKKTMEKVQEIAAALPNDYLTNKACHLTKKKLEEVSGGYLFKKGKKVVFIDTEHVLGEGVNKTVFLAYDIFNKEICAYAEIKNSNMSKKDKQAVSQEVELMKKFKGSTGKNVIGGIGNVLRNKHDEIQGFLLPFYNRGNLQNYLDNHLDDAKEEDLWIIADDIIHSLEVLAKAKDPVFHRDLKDANIMLHRDTDGKLHAKVIDFGMATTISRENDLQKVKKRISICGTVGYISPEVIKSYFKKNKGKISDEKFSKHVNSSKRDVWAVGLILYEMLKKTRPQLASFSESSFLSTMKYMDDDAFDQDFSEQASDRFMSLKKPKTIEDVVRYALSCDPKFRYSAQELRQHMSRLKAQGAKWRAG